MSDQPMNGDRGSEAPASVDVIGTNFPDRLHAMVARAGA